MPVEPTDPYISLAGLADAYRTGAVKPSSVIDAHLDRIGRLDPKIGAYQAVYAGEVRAAAEAADKAIASGHRIGPFHGIPFGLKDICDLEGRITTGGSMAMKDRVSPVTATIARRLIAAGGIVLGKTKTVECAFGGWGTNQRMGTPWNPWDMETHRVPGGSSAGSAAALAAGMAVCAVGTDTGGSVRLPAAFCGLTGLKVTEGRLPTDGILPLSHTLDTPGPLARSVLDAIMMFEVMDGREGWAMDRDRAAGAGLYAVLGQGIQGLRLGALDERERAACSAAVLEAYDAALEVLRGLGAVIAVFTPPRGYAEITGANGRLISAEAYAHHGPMYENPDNPMDEDVRPRVLAGRDVTAAAYIGILRDRQVAQAGYYAAMRGFDAVLTPTVTVTAPPVAEVDQLVSPGHFTRPFNYLGMCGLAMPTGLAPGGLPTSLQIAARGGEEATALRIGAALEAALPGLARPGLR
jgi:aspartyl-tRNA(Asn)/glutamyl-tRNA(Gln) amidotransferase subunit A